MSTGLNSLVTQLLYRQAPQLNFAKLVADIRGALMAETTQTVLLTWDCDDIAFLDIDAACIVLGFSENLPGPFLACLTVAAGQSKIAGRAVLAKSDQIALCQKVADRLNMLFPSDAHQTQTHDEPLSPDLIDRVVDVLFHQDHDKPDAVIVKIEPDRFAVDAEETLESKDMDRLLKRLSSELVARTPNIISRAIASAAPKGRVANVKDQTKASTGTSAVCTKGAQAPTNGPKTKCGLFWRTGQKPQLIAAEDTQDAHPFAASSASLNELKAVRDVLCARDITQTFNTREIAARARMVLSSLTVLSHRAPNKIGSVRGDDQAAEKRLKH